MRECYGKSAKYAVWRNNHVMSDQDPKIAEDQEQFQLQEEYLKSLDDIEEGQLVDGVIVEISPETVFIDIGYKSEGKIAVTEFKQTPSIGDTVTVLLVSKEGRQGSIIVSKEKADEQVFWKDIRKAYENNEPIEGKFSKAIKGGFEVDLGFGAIAFNPLSKTDIRRVEDPEAYVGMESKFLIDRYHGGKRAQIVLSRRDWLERDVSQRRDEFFRTTEIDQEVEGAVKSFTSFGAFVDLGGFDGLLHINDMSWGHVTRPRDYVKKGEKIKLKVIKMDPVEMKINLSLKHFTPDPWTYFEDKYQVGDVVHGRVTKLADFGAFIEVEEGIEGLAHISELSWVKRVQHPKELLSIGDEVETKILGYDIQQGRVSLGLKQVMPNPWDTIEESYPVGMRLTKPIKKITNAGAFIEIEPGIDGFLHVDDISWTKKIRNPSSVLKEGEELEVAIISIDRENRRLRLGIKQLSDDPWEALAATHPKGSVVEGEITNITDFGLFVRVQEGIEGLVSKFQVKETEPGSDTDPMEGMSVGMTVKALVTDVNPKRQRLALSIRSYQDSLQREEMSKYIHDEDLSATVTLGDMLKTKGSSSDE